MEQFAGFERAEAKIAEAVLKTKRHGDEIVDRDANRALAIEEARLRAEAGRVEAQARLAEARLQLERAEDALADYRASRPKRARVAEIEDAATSD